MTTELDINILRALGNFPRVHPNGFIQFDLVTPGRRMHIWPKPGVFHFGQNSDSPIHDHIFRMKSMIIRGSLTQLRYQLDLSHEGKPTHEIFIADYLKQSESVLKPTGVEGLLRHDIAHNDALVENEMYHQPPFTFHDTQPGRTPLVTIMQKGEVFAEYNPRVLVPIGETPDNDFRRDQYSEDLLWEIIEDALA